MPKTFDIMPPALRDPVKAQLINNAIGEMSAASASLLNALLGALGGGDLGDIYTIKGNLAKLMHADDVDSFVDLIEKRRITQEAFLASVSGR